jgi:mitochondrial splicing suppressor protein 51
MLFPSTHFHLFFIGPQVSLPKPPSAGTDSPVSEPAETATPPTPEATTEVSEQKAYVPNVYQPPTPAPIPRMKRTRSSLERYGIPSYTVPYTHQLTITGMQANYADVHAQFQHTLDPYSDVFFFFAPGFGFPSMDSVDPETNEPYLQVASPTEWGPVLPMLLATKCTMFVTGFSPADVERDVRSLSKAPEVAGEFEWVVTPGPNEFGSLKLEVGDFDPRVQVRANWGIWAIRGKSRDVQESSKFTDWLKL